MLYMSVLSARLPGCAHVPGVVLAYCTLYFSSLDLFNLVWDNNSSVTTGNQECTGPFQVRIVSFSIRSNQLSCSLT